MDRLGPTRRPDGAPRGHHRWRTLLFLHWELDAAALRPLVPRELEIDTFDGKAYVGLVPFTMEGVRPTWLPEALAFAFHETNVRTYVHRRGRDPGVYFFSLDAASTPAVVGARVGWSLPYYRAEISLARVGASVRYRTRRLPPGPRPADASIDWEIGASRGCAEAGTLTHFLAERYILYARRGGALLSGRVHHPPYPLHDARVTRLEQTLLDAAGLSVTGPPMSALFSPGVDVDVFALTESV